MAAVTVGLVLSGQAIILYPLALLSALGVLVLLMMLDTLGVLLVTRRSGARELASGGIAAIIGLYAGDPSDRRDRCRAVRVVRHLGRVPIAG